MTATRNFLLMTLAATLLAAPGAVRAVAIGGDVPMGGYESQQPQEERRSALYPPLNDPQNQYKNRQALKALQEMRRGERDKAYKRLQEAGMLNQVSGKAPDATPEQVQQERVKQYELQEAEQKKLEEEQKRVQEDYRRQQLQQYLFEAIRQGHLNWVEYAVKNGASIHEAYSNFMPVQYAVASKKLDIARWLIEQGASYGSRENAYYMILHQAAWAGDKELIEMMLRLGADTRVEDATGKQAWQYAKNRELQEMLITTGNRKDAVPGAATNAQTAPEAAPTQAPTDEDELFPTVPGATGVPATTTPVKAAPDKADSGKADSGKQAAAPAAPAPSPAVPTPAAPAQ